MSDGYSSINKRPEITVLDVQFVSQMIPKNLNEQFLLKDLKNEINNIFTSFPNKKVAYQKVFEFIRSLEQEETDLLKKYGTHNTL